MTISTSLAPIVIMSLEMRQLDKTLGKNEFLFLSSFEKFDVLAHNAPTGPIQE